MIDGCYHLRYHGWRRGKLIRYLIFQCFILPETMTDAGYDKKIMMTIFLIAMVSLGWGLSFLFLALLLEEMAPAQMLAIRWSLMALEFLALILIGKIRFRLKGKNVFFLFLTGLCEPCAYCILEAYGIKMTSASVSAIFVATVPCMTLFLGVLLFHKRADRKMLAGILAAFLGVVIATVCSPTFSLAGTKTGLICMSFAIIACSMYSLSSAKASADYDAMSVTAVMAFEGAVFFDIICFCQGYGPDTFLLLFLNGKTLACFLLLAVFCAFASYICYNRLMSYVEPALANNIVGSLSTVIGVVAGILVVGDTWGWYTVAGLVVTLIGVWMSSMRMKEDL